MSLSRDTSITDFIHFPPQASSHWHTPEHMFQRNHWSLPYGIMCMHAAHAMMHANSTMQRCMHACSSCNSTMQGCMHAAHATAPCKDACTQLMQQHHAMMHAAHATAPCKDACTQLMQQHHAMMHARSSCNSTMQGCMHAVHATAPCNDACMQLMQQHHAMMHACMQLIQHAWESSGNLRCPGNDLGTM
jgi:hypothetical protein